MHPAQDRFQLRPAVDEEGSHLSFQAFALDDLHSSELDLRCPPAGSTAADESLLCGSVPNRNFALSGLSNPRPVTMFLAP
jgi:hypothetical protein